MRAPLSLLFVVALFLALVGCAPSHSSSLRSGQAQAVTTSAVLPPPDTTSADGAYTGLSEYRIGPYDLLTISVFQVDEMNRDVRVNSSGQFSLPLIGTIQAGGKTVQELEHEIADKLAQGYLQDPQVSVFVKEFTSQRVTVEGAVAKPGIFPITGRTSLLQSIAMAQGPTPLADESTVVIFRYVKGRKMAALFDLKKIRAGEMEDPMIYGDDIVVVDTSGSKSAIKAITDSLRGFIGFRAY